MNGRMYDPALGRMLSPDAYVQNALFSQSYNRYSYCVNNPLKWIDPTGESMTDGDNPLGQVVILGWHPTRAAAGGGSGGSGFDLTSNYRTSGVVMQISISDLIKDMMKDMLKQMTRETISSINANPIPSSTPPATPDKPKGSGTDDSSESNSWITPNFFNDFTWTTGIIGSGTFNDPYQLNEVIVVGTKRSYYYPLPFYTNSFIKGSAQFGSRRSGGKRSHAGIDLYAPVGTEVYSITTGIVRRISPNFYLGSSAIEIDHYSYIGRYAEIKPIEGLKVGANVSAGEVIGNVMDLHLSNSMLHYEMYEGTVNGTLTNTSNLPYMRRSDLLNPTNYILILPLK